MFSSGPLEISGCGSKSVKPEADRTDAAWTTASVMAKDQESRMSLPDRAMPRSAGSVRRTSNSNTWLLAPPSRSVPSASSERGWTGFDLGFDYTWSDTRSQIDVTAATLTAAPLPELRRKLRSISAWAMIDVSARSSIRLTIEGSKLSTDDFALDNVVPNTLSNVLTRGESAANYDIILVTGSYTHRF